LRELFFFLGNAVALELFLAEPPRVALDLVVPERPDVDLRFPRLRPGREVRPSEVCEDLFPWDVLFTVRPDELALFVRESVALFEREPERLLWPSERAVSGLRLTNLLKLLRSPSAVASCTSNARLLSSNLSNQSFQSIVSSESLPLYPGKSNRINPTSSLPPVLRTAAGFAPRSSAHC
jgi:hypothetical protein